MNLPSTYQYKGWSIRYGLLEFQFTPSSDGESEKKSLVFVHGTPWSSAVFQPIVKALLAKDSYQILLYDLPGYGQSQVFEEPDSSGSTQNIDSKFFAGDTSVRFQALALEALLKHVNMDAGSGQPLPAVIAHDIAGAIVLRAHLILGCEFESMMLCDTNAVLPWGDGFYKLVRSEPDVFMQLPPNVFEAVVRAVIQSARCNADSSHGVWEDTLALPWIMHPGEPAGVESAKRQQNFVRQIAQANDGDVAEMLDADMYDQIRCDVKIVWGEEDKWIPREKIEELVKRIGSRVKECAFIPDAGHLVMLDQPERFAIEAFAWLTRSS